MKRTLALILLVTLVLGLCACGASKEVKFDGFAAGYSRVSIHTNKPISLSAYDNRTSTGFLDYVYATCIALTGENGQTALLFTVDLIGASDTWAKESAQQVSQATGVPTSNIIYLGTHTHSAPRVSSSKEYKEEVLLPALLKAAQEAMADRAVATVQTGAVTVEDMNFIRHYTMTDGTIAGDNFGNWSTADAVDNVSVADNEMQLVRLVRQDKKDILLVNWQAHPKLASTGSTKYGKANRTMMSSDYVGAMRKYVEEADADLQFAFFLGASGDVNPLDVYIKAHQKPEHATEKTYGIAMGAKVIEALPGLKDVSGTLDVNSTHTMLKVTPEDGKGRNELPVYSTCIGDAVGFTTFPGEMFNGSGEFVKENSPFDTTFVLTVAMHHASYIPTEVTFEYMNYEVNSTHYVCGTAEKLCDEMVRQLEELK